MLADLKSELSDLLEKKAAVFKAIEDQENDLARLILLQKKETTKANNLQQKTLAEQQLLSQLNGEVTTLNIKKAAVCKAIEDQERDLARLPQTCC